MLRIGQLTFSVTRVITVQIAPAFDSRSDRLSPEAGGEDDPRG